MKPSTSKKQTVVKLLKKQAVIRPRDLATRNIARTTLSRLCTQGIVQKVGHGLYRLTNAEASEHDMLIEACMAVPNGVVCLLSALRFHELTTQSPHQIWMAIDVKARIPKTELPIKYMRFSGSALQQGVLTRKLHGASIRVYSPAKTVADCFKFRNKIGLDVALEALRECNKKGLCSIDELWQYAKLCRVGNVMRPYLETMTL
jgi:predicted transcriptional regulator of viral defense system